MAIQRDNIAQGPGLVTLGAVKFHDKDGITSELMTETERIQSSQQGELSPHIIDQTGKTTFTPIGALTAAILAKLYPAAYTTPNIGASIFGATDEACLVHSRAGTQVTWVNSALTTMPELFLSAKKTALGSAEITHLLKYDTERSVANSLVGPIASVAFTDTGATESDIKMVRYTAAWGVVLAGIQAAEGWTVTPELQIEARQVDDYGTIDYTLKLVRVSAKCRPLMLGESDLLDNLPTGQDIGSIPAKQHDLTITGVGGLTVVLKNATLMQGPLKYGNTELRAGEVVFEANPDASTGELFSVALTP